MKNMSKPITFTWRINLLYNYAAIVTTIVCQLSVAFRSIITISNAAFSLIQSFVVSRLDYCNALCAGLPAARTGSSDRVLRKTARHVDHIPSLGHVTDYMYMYMRDVLSFPLFPQHGLTLSRSVGLWLLGALLLECPVLWFSSIF